MGQISETSAFDPAVYQWETTDSVTGGPDGIANAPLKNLTNRTRFLNDKLALLQAQIVPLAPVNSPNFTGSPTVPTPSMAAKTNEVATAALARNFASGLLNIAMSGNYQLSTIEAGYATFILIGTLQNPGFLLLPTNAFGRWTFYNATNLTVSVRLSQGGQIITVASGCAQTIIANGADCFPAHSDYTNANLQGSPITSPPTLDDNSLRVTNTAWVNARIAQEAYARNLADQQIRADVASGYALQTALASEASTRLAQDTNEAALRYNADTTETAARIAGDNAIRADVAVGYATKLALASEASTRDVQDNQIRADVENTYMRKGQVKAGNGHANFTPGDYADVPVSLNFTTGSYGGIVFVTSSLALSFQIPNAVTLDLYLGDDHTNTETTFTTIPVQAARYVPPNTTIIISAHARTGGGGGWCQMALGLACVFVPNG